MNAECKQPQQQQQQQENVKDDLKQQHQQQQTEEEEQQIDQYREQHHHHVHCIYEKDDTQLHQHHHKHSIQYQHHIQHQQEQQQQQEQLKRQPNLDHFDEQAAHYAAEYSLPFQHPLQKQKQQTPKAIHQNQRRHSHGHCHSPHHSRHTSPHSRHSSPHSRHVSPHNRHTSPHSRHTSPHSRHTSPHSRQLSPQFGHAHEHAHEFSEHAPKPIIVDSFSRNLAHRTSIRSTVSHSHAHQHHSHHHRRKRHQRYHHHHHHPIISTEQQLHTDQNWPNTGIQNETCMHRHRSNIEVSNASVNVNCSNPQCVNNESRHDDLAFAKVSGCCNSRTDIAQYFAEDLYGTVSRRPSSCCTSSDYCYQTDSTSLYGSRSSLSRNNSIKSAVVTFRQKKYNKRKSSYTSLGALNTSRPNSNMGSLSSIFNRVKDFSNANGTAITEQQLSKENVNINELPQYACSPSPIRWSFLADAKSPTDSLERKSISCTETSATSNGYQRKVTKAQPLQEQYEKKSERHERCYRTSKTHDRNEKISTTSNKCCNNISKHCEESTTVQFHQEGEPYNNCCSNYIQCNSYLDQDLQITSEDIHQYLSKGSEKSGSILNNAKTYPFQPSNALEFQYKNNFANNNQATSNTLSSVEGAESLHSYDGRFRGYASKKTNLNQNVAITETCMSGTCVTSSCSSGTPLSPTNINLSASTNNINIVFNSYRERNPNNNEVKFINTESNTQAPVNYPAYDFTNMSTASTFEKPLGIDELPKEFCNKTNIGDNGSSSQHSSSLQSPEPNQVSFESFDACSHRNLLSRQGSCHYSSTPRTPRSLNSPTNSSIYSTSINPISTSYMPHVHYDYPTGVRHQQNLTFNINNQHQQQQQQQSQQQPSTSTVAATLCHDHRHHYHHHHHHHQQHNSESFKLSNALKKVRKRARKYTDFLRKK